MIISHKHYLAELIIRQVHEDELLHIGGTNHVLSKVGEKFWITRIRPLIRRILKRCVICTRNKKYPVRSQQIDAPLPDERVPNVRPRAFENIMMDAAGPFLIKQARSIVKRYIIIFTCMTYRGLHNEVVHSLDTNSFLMALDRFTATRGRPVRIWSDNGTNFVGANKILKEMIAQANQSDTREKYLS